MTLQSHFLSRCFLFQEHTRLHAAEVGKQRGRKVEMLYSKKILLQHFQLLYHLSFKNFIFQMTAMLPYTLIQTNSLVLLHSFKQVELVYHDVFFYGAFSSSKSPCMIKSFENISRTTSIDYKQLQILFSGSFTVEIWHHDSGNKIHFDIRNDTRHQNMYFHI